MSDDMEEVPIQNDTPMTLLNFSFEKHGFEYNFLSDFEFDDKFSEMDAGQIQKDPTIVNEEDLLIRLKDVQKRDSGHIPPTIYAFYDKCKKHFAEEFISLLIGLMTNIEKAQKLKDHNNDDRLLDFFDIKLRGPLNFGKHKIFEETAAECDNEAKHELRECGAKLQKLVQAGRERAIDASRAKLQACSEDFKAFGEKEWRTQCEKTSMHNILDQHFAVECHRTAEDTTLDAESESDDEFSKPPSNGDTERRQLWKASTWLYNVAIHESKKDVDREIRKRRAQKLKDRADAAILRNRQREVDISADAAKPEVTLGNHLRRLDERLDTMNESLSSIQATNPTQGKTLSTTGAIANTQHEGAILVQQLRQQVVTLQNQMQTLLASGQPDAAAPKNDTRADSAAPVPQQSAGISESKRRRTHKRPRPEETGTTSAQTTWTAPDTQPKRTVIPYPRPPAQHQASGNETRANQPQRNRHQGGQRQQSDRAQMRDDAQQPQDGRRRHNNDQGRPTSSWSNRSGGRGRDPGRV